MSLFLGPIHHLYWAKIVAAARRVAAEFRALEAIPIDGLRKAVGFEPGDLEPFEGGRPLEELVEGQHIHGYLEERIMQVDLAEARLLAKATELGGDAALATAREAARQAGVIEAMERKAQGGAPTAPLDFLGAFDMAHCTTLPCSPVADPRAEGDAAIYRQTQLSHAAPWGREGLPIEKGMEVLAGWYEGLAEGFGWKLESLTTPTSSNEPFEATFSQI